MALNKEIKIDQITVTDNFVVMIRERTVIMENNAELSQTYHRTTLEPGDDYSKMPENVIKICEVMWTPEIIAEYQAKKNAAFQELLSRQTQGN